MWHNVELLQGRCVLFNHVDNNTLSLKIRSTIISFITGIKSSIDIFIYYLQFVTLLIRVFLQFTCQITSFPYP